ncbi:MAG: transcriptional regulator [Pseudanabaena sp.]|nr:MAG: transcriptional regulator [Pseudanabaena sp.]
MAMTKSRILEAVHETAMDMFEAGVMDQITMREFDILCLPKIEKLEPQKIKAIRETAQVSQAVFAAVLNTSVSTVQKWEIGQKRPSGTALKLLHIVEKRGLDAIAI